MKRSGKVQLIDASKCFEKRRKNIGNKRVDLNDECINLIMKAYSEFNKNKVYTKGNYIVESKVLDNSFFGYTKVAVETAQTDEKGNQILKKGKPVAEKGKTDYEIIPLNDDINAYFEKNVLPYNRNAFMDRSKDKIGYEVPFTRLFYKFEQPQSSDEIFAEIKKLGNEEAELMKALFN